MALWGGVIMWLARPDRSVFGVLALLPADCGSGAASPNRRQLHHGIFGVLACACQGDSLRAG